MDSFAYDLECVLYGQLVERLLGVIAKQIIWRGEDGPLVKIHYADDPGKWVVVEIPRDAGRTRMRELIAPAVETLFRSRDPYYFR